MSSILNIPRVTSKYLVAAKAAVQFTRRVLDIGASNKMAPWDWWGKVTAALCAGSVLNKGTLQERIDEEMARTEKQKKAD